MKELNLNKNYEIINKKNIALIGHMGSGKTLLGKLIAKKLKIEHIDSDKLIEKNTNQTINSIFQTHGESYFRSQEEDIILKLKDKINISLSLGGGAITSLKIRKFLKKNFITVFIDVKINVLVERLKKTYNQRPLLKNVDIKRKIKELDCIRRKYYILADIIIEKNNNPNESLTNFLEEYNKL